MDGRFLFADHEFPVAVQTPAEAHRRFLLYPGRLAQFCTECTHHLLAQARRDRPFGNRKKLAVETSDVFVARDTV